MTRTGEKGVALVFTLFLMAALSAMAVSMMFLAQTETSASRNYKTMSQARYAGEAGVQRAVHYLSSTAYTNSVTSTSGFDTSVSPVRYSNADVVLRPVAANSNHPDTTIKDAFAALFSGASLGVGNNATVTYSATATLLSMRQMAVYGGGTGVIQTWRINATGTVPGTLPATVEVAAILERDATAAETYAIFATGGGCAAIDLGGGAETNSYDSSSMTLSGTPPQPVTQNHSGAVGTNGNLRLVGGQTTVNGNLDTPRTGVGNCNSGNITALDGNPPQVTGDTIQLPQAKTYPDPAPPTPTPPTTPLSIPSASCTGLGITIPDSCLASGSTITITKNNPLTAISWGNVAVSGTTNIVITAGALFGTGAIKLNVNSISLTGNSTISLGANTSLTMNVAGTGVSPDVVDFEGGSFANGSFDPSKFQILYAGTQRLKLTGGTSAAATVYAPNAAVQMTGGTDFYGSVLSRTFSANSHVAMHYDRSLATKFFTLGNNVMSSFSWQKY